jgi:hypothetical protein
MKQDFDTQEQVEAFHEYCDNYPAGRQISMAGGYGYTDAEWQAFQEGWNAAKKHFGIE